MDKVALLRELALAATPGPWAYKSEPDQLGEYVCDVTSGDGCRTTFSVGTIGDWGYMRNPARNAAYIAAANPYAILDLIAEVEALRKAGAAMIKGIDDWNASMEKVIGKQPGYHWPALEELRALVAGEAV